MQPKEGQQQFKNRKQPELTENQTVWKSDNQGDKEETLTQMVGGAETGSQEERTPGKVADCGTGQARLQLADPTMWWLADPAAPHSCIDKLGGMVGE